MLYILERSQQIERGYSRGYIYISLEFSHLKEELKHVQKNEPFLSGLIFTDPGIALLDIFIRQILVILIRMIVQNSKLDLILKSSLSYMCKWYFATINILIFFN